MVPVLAVRKCPADPQEAEVLMAQRLAETAQLQADFAENCIVHSAFYVLIL